MTISGWLDPSKDTFVKELHQQHNFLSKKKEKIKGIGGSTVLAADLRASRNKAETGDIRAAVAGVLRAAVSWWLKAAIMW